MASFKARLRSHRIRLATSLRGTWIGVKDRISTGLNKIRYRPFFRRALKHAVVFHTSSGSRVQIIPEAVSVIKSPAENNPGRPMVVVLIGGKKIYFYKSSGKQSRRPGKWLPTSGIRPTIRMEGKKVHFTGVKGLVKMKSHWNSIPYPLEIVEVGEKIEQLDHAGKIPVRFMSITRLMAFQAKWGLWPSYARYNHAGEPYLVFPGPVEPR